MKVLLRFMLWGQLPDPVTVLDAYRRLLAQPDGDGYARTHRRTQVGDPPIAQQWCTRSQGYQAAAALIAYDERYRLEIMPSYQGSN